MRELEASLHYNFKNPHLLHQALTHTSKTGKLSENYERLELLADRKSTRQNSSHNNTSRMPTYA